MKEGLPRLTFKIDPEKKQLKLLNFRKTVEFISFSQRGDMI